MDQRAKRVLAVATAAVGGLLLVACSESQYSSSGTGSSSGTAAPAQSTIQPGYGFDTEAPGAYPPGGENKAAAGANPNAPGESPQPAGATMPGSSSAGPNTDSGAAADSDNNEPGSAEAMQPGTASTGSNVSSGRGPSAAQVQAQPAGATISGSGAGSALAEQPGTASTGSNPSRDIGGTRSSVTPPSGSMGTDAVTDQSGMSQNSMGVPTGSTPTDQSGTSQNSMGNPNDTTSGAVTTNPPRTTAQPAGASLQSPDSSSDAGTYPQGAQMGPQGLSGKSSTTQPTTMPMGSNSTHQQPNAQPAGSALPGNQQNPNQQGNPDMNPNPARQNDSSSTHNNNESNFPRSDQQDMQH